MPSAAGEMISPRTRILVDLTGLTEFRMQAHQTTTGQSTARIFVQYSTDQNTWSNLESGGTVTELTANGTGFRVSAYGTIAAAARSDVYLRVAGSGGNGAADPAWTGILLQAR